MGKLYNLARMGTATVGTGTLTVGSAIPPFLTFALAGVSNGDKVSYSIQDGNNSEAGWGAYSSGTLTRNVRTSTNSNAAISLSGNAQVMIDSLAEDFENAGVVTMRYVLGTWVVFTPDGLPVNIASSTTSGLQEAINYAQTNGYNLEVQGPSSTSAGSVPAVIACTTQVTFGPADYKSYHIAGCVIQFNAFSGNAVFVDTLNQCVLDCDATIQRSGGGAGDSTLTIFPHTAEPIFGSKTFQQNWVKFRGVTHTGSVSAQNQSLVTILCDTNANIINNGLIHFGALDCGSAANAGTCIRINTPTAPSAINDNVFGFDLCIGASVSAIFNGTSAPTGGAVLAANVWSGSIESTKTGVSSHIQSYSSYDTYNISSMDIDAGTVTDGFSFQTGAVGNNVRCPEIIATTNAFNFASGSNNNYFEVGLASSATIVNSGTGNRGVLNGKLYSDHNPCFSAHKNGTDQTGVTAATYTQVTFGTEAYDYGSYFASSAWTPLAGLVSMVACIQTSGTIAVGAIISLAIYKNGSAYKYSNNSSVLSQGGAIITVDDVANGSDVYTVYCYQANTSGTVTFNGPATTTYFQGKWISP